MSDPIHERLSKLEALMRELENVLQSVLLNDSSIFAAAGYAAFSQASQ
ncbi:MAG: hypothetical protein ACREQ4_06745 [Candidatus Binataceae bacterium]